MPEGIGVARFFQQELMASGEGIGEQLAHITCQRAWVTR